nr:hypothetical protein CFP56_20904 [Quercus suber]
MADVTVRPIFSDHPITLASSRSLALRSDCRLHGRCRSCQRLLWPEPCSHTPDEAGRTADDQEGVSSTLASAATKLSRRRDVVRAWLSVTSAPSRTTAIASADRPWSSAAMTVRHWRNWQIKAGYLARRTANELDFNDACAQRNLERKPTTDSPAWTPEREQPECHHHNFVGPIWTSASHPDPQYVLDDDDVRDMATDAPALPTRCLVFKCRSK